MKSGEVAVEKSVNAFPNLKSTKLKNHITMSPYGSPAHQHKQAQLPRLAQYQPHLLVPVQMPYQPQQFAMLQTYPVAQPLSPYHRYAAAMNYARSRTATGYQLLHMYPQPPPLPPQPHSAVKRNTKPIQPPISMPTQLQSPPDMDHLRARTKRSVCLRFARGMCQFGSTCKFSHDCTIKISDMPQSAPVSISERVQPQVSPVPCDQLQDNQNDVPISLHDSNFPSLSPETGVSDKSSNLSGDPGDDNQLHSPPSKKLVFRDAVLQQTRKSAEVNPLNWSSPLKTSSSCGEEPSAKPDDRVADSNDQTPAHNKEDQNQPRKGQANVVQAERVNDPLRRSRDPSRSPDRKPGRRGYQLHQKPQLPEAFFRQQQHLQVVLPPSGQPGYAVQPVYLVNQGGSDTRSTLSSALSREAIGFVKRIDSKLQEQAFVQQLALSKLQEVATSIWSDSTIGIYGSSFTRLALPHSDIDCVLTSPSASDKQPAVLLKKLEIELRRLSWARRVELLGNAKIPVLKIVFCQSSMSTSEVMLDLTCSHSPGHSGLNARELIYSFQVEMPALRPLVLILKSHIQRRGLNSVYTGGLSSYGLVLLAVRFLQACGDEHHLVETEANRGHNMSSSGLAQLRSGDVPPVYEFTRNGKPAWRTGLGNLLLLFLETYVTFDYRRFGITVEGSGQYFPLPADKVSLEPGAVVSPYIVDPIESTRSIGSCFRMHDIIHAWYELYQQLTNGISIENAISTRSHASSPV